VRIGEKYKMNQASMIYPNLPQKRIKAVILGEKYQHLSNCLKQLGIYTILSGKNTAVSPNISDHVDLSVFHAGEKRLIVSEVISDSLVSLKSLGYQLFITQKPLYPNYPYEASLNACLVGPVLFHKTAVTDAHILAEAKKNRWRMVHVNQGYTKCSVCVLDENNIITSDIGIHKAARQSGIESLLISPGQIELPGYSSGMLGGACGKISKNEIVFTGTLKHHTDERKIIAHIRSLGIIPIFLTQEPCFDIGSMIPLPEE
jgi:hypothetical protein